MCDAPRPFAQTLQRYWPLLVGLVAVTQTKVVDSASSQSAQAAPHFGQLNPDFVNCQQRLTGSSALTGGTAQLVTGFAPPVDLKQLKGQEICSALVSSASLPASYNLRALDKSPVKLQGSCAACCAFATSELIRRLQQVLGHTNINTTAVYLKFNDQDLQYAYADVPF